MELKVSITKIGTTCTTNVPFLLLENEESELLATHQERERIHRLGILQWHELHRLLACVTMKLKSFDPTYRRTFCLEN